MSENDTPETPETSPEQESSQTNGQSKGRKFASDSPTMGEILRLKKPNEKSCMIVLDPSLQHELDEVEAELEMLDRNQNRINRTGGSLADDTNKRIEELLSKYADLEEQAEDVTVEFRFQDIGRRRYDELVHKHPPTDEEKKEYKDAGGEGVLPYSFNTFPPALVAATSLEPKITEVEATEMFSTWSEGDLEHIFNTALLVCKEPSSVPKSRPGIEKIRGSLRNSTTAPSEESPTLSS